MQNPIISWDLTWPGVSVGKRQSANCCFFLEPARGRAQKAGQGSAPSLARGWGQDVRTEGSVQSPEINSFLVFSLLLWMQKEALGDPWGSESRGEQQTQPCQHRGSLQGNIKSMSCFPY